MQCSVDNSASDWMNATPSDWLDRYVPGWRQTSYGDLMRTRPADWPKWFRSQYALPGGGSSLHPFYGPPRRHHMRHPRDCECRECRRSKGWDSGRHECRRCGCEPCECFCCIGDVDLVVYARVGEHRVIPIVVENERRREKSVTLELSNWRTRGGGTSLVETTDTEPKTFNLPPCREQKITISVRIREPEPASGTPPSEEQRGERGKSDVDECVVAYADLRSCRVRSSVYPHRHRDPAALLRALRD